MVVYPGAGVEWLSPATAPFLSLPNLRRVYLDQPPLLDSPNPKLWLVALIVAGAGKIAPIVQKVQAHQAARPADGIDWPDLLETVLVYKPPLSPARRLRKCSTSTTLA